MVKSVRALDRGLTVLELLRQHDAATLGDLHETTALPRATLLRVLKTLEERDWVCRSAVDGLYRLGPRWSPRDDAALPGGELAALAAPFLNELCKRALWPSGVAIRDGRSMLILETLRRNSPFTIDRSVIGHRPSLLKSATGRAYLAFCPAKERSALLKDLRASENPDDKVAHMTRWVDRVLTDTRRRGYGVRETGHRARTNRLDASFNAIAVPVIVEKRVAACVNMLWIGGVIGVADFARRHLPDLRRTAEGLGVALARKT
jgi:IclR family transcriptional regulator, mhp operon transcriptional activator